MPSSQTPCVKSVVSLLKICSDGRPDLTQSHIAPEMQIVDTLPLASPTVCFLFFIIVFLIQTKEKEALKQAAFNMSRHSNIYPCRIQLRFSPLFFSRSRSSKALKLLLSFFHNNVPDIINLSQCSCHTMLCVRLCRGGGEGRTDISDINHRLVHHSACPRTRRFTAAAPRVVSVYNLCLLLFYLLCALSV